MPTSKNQMERLILILDMIRTGQYPNSTDFLKRLMEKPAVSGTPMVPVSKHTVLRDIQDLRTRFGSPVEYDPMGNRASSVLVNDSNSASAAEALAYSSNNLNQYTEIFNQDGSATTPSYDLNGNSLFVVPPSGGSSWSLSWNIV